MATDISPGSPARERQSLPNLGTKDRHPALHTIQPLRPGGSRPHMSLANDSGPSVCLISRQRIIGKTNGSSAYILSIVEYLKANGFRIHYVSPSPSTFGRWPFMRLRAE